MNPDLRLLILLQPRRYSAILPPKPSEGKLIMWLPDFSDVMEIHYGLAEVFANDEDPISPPGPRDVNLVHSACNRPLTSMGNIEKYGDEFQKLAALFHSLTQNHAFHNGNKRTALVTLLASLYRNGRVLAYEISDDEIFELTVSVARGSFINFNGRIPSDEVVEKIAHWLKRNSMARNVSPSDMSVTDFIERCIALGCQYKEYRGSYHLSNGENSIRIGVDTLRFAGPVARKYLKLLGMSFEKTGMTFAEFQNADPEEREQIYRFMSVLRRLAKI